MTVAWTQAKMKTVALEERTELGLGVMDPLDPYELAELHGIATYPITALVATNCPPETIEYFTRTDPKALSAALIPRGSARFIIENDAHEAVRRRSSVAHEMSHHLLEHEFGATLIAEDHSRLYCDKAEKQALFLSGELLVPDEACRKLAFRQASNEDVAAMFNVSTQFAQMRMKGVRVMAARALQKQRRRA